MPVKAAPENGSEADREAQHFHAAGARNAVVTQFMDHDQHSKRDDKSKQRQNHANTYDGQAATHCSAQARAQASSASKASRSDSASPAFCWEKAVSTASMIRGISRYAQRRDKKAATATSLAAFSDTQAPCPSSSALKASPRQGKRARSGASKSRRPCAIRSSGDTPASTRSG